MKRQLYSGPISAHSIALPPTPLPLSLSLSLSHCCSAVLYHRTTSFSSQSRESTKTTPDSFAI